MGPTHVIPELLERCRRKADPLTVFGADQSRSFLYVEDAAVALRLVAKTARSDSRGGIFNIGSADEVRIADLARLVLETSGHRASIEPRPAPPGSVSRRVPDVSRLARLGFRPAVPLEAGVRACWRP
jgi:UDP-glucose 4-epimerase/UDP-glucuronate decarboxylase